MILSLENINYKIENRFILKDINMKLSLGEIVTLIGPNGAGKTTLIRIIINTLHPSSGKRFLQHGIRIGYMPQKMFINSGVPLTVYRFLSLGDAPKKRILETLNLVGALHTENYSVHHLSGGEQQRVLLARAILHQPHLLVLDEPAQGVDVVGQSAIYSLITKLRNQLNCAVLMVSHDLHMVMSSTDYVLCLNQHICCEGVPSLVKQHPVYKSLFGPAMLTVYEHDTQHHHAHEIF